MFNRAAEQMFRCRSSEAIGAPLERFVPERFRAAHRIHVEQFGRTGVTARKMGDVTTLWALRPSTDEEFPIEASISRIHGGGRAYLTVILRDITLRKQYEGQIERSQREVRDLSARMFDALEEEKRRIARELHDELGQLLTTLKMDLSWLRERLPADSLELTAKTDEMDVMLDRTITSTRRISADMRPLMLDDLGLADAANWLVNDFSKRCGVKCKIQIVGEERLEDLPKILATTIFRAVQESLTNIARHSGAHNAWVRLEAQDGIVEVEIEDDGRGIRPEDLGKIDSLGLRGMRERVAYLGGALEVARPPRGGTRLTLRVPLRSQAAHIT